MPPNLASAAPELRSPEFRAASIPGLLGGLEGRHPRGGNSSSTQGARCSQQSRGTSRSDLPEERAEEVRSHYEVLGVPSDASQEEIRRIYYGLCKVYHPDKSSSSVYAGRLCAIQQAYTVLSDETKRLLYDIRIGIYKGKDKWTKVAEVYQIQRKRAARDIENMRIDYQNKLDQERKVGGLVIRKALYGNLRLRRALLEQDYKGPIKEGCLEGPFLDVTIPLQCQVDNSRFIFPGGSGSSMELLNGFYNPAPCVREHDICLYVLYEFKGAFHEVTVCDRSYLAIPLKGHRVSPAIGPRGPYAPSNVQPLRTQSPADGKASPRTQRTHPGFGSSRNSHTLSETTKRERALREAQDMRDRRLRSLLLWASSLCLYACAYDKASVTDALSTAVGERAAARCSVFFPPTLSPESQRAWLRILHFGFLSEMWPFSAVRS
ncbi:DnaJ domain-containing protein [Besnoitia besnoiti]|uniref:DnaJ domain-containing protein n=1 Tax=Besnoitia besnoiti TaxID=94643 RepID=A0A2A9M6R9_BESBE|nr:DnaJ domain-containing protein [Besnoitia besnoiti]PFH32884.1 DnaJ domain-containing protein [Besnoitia besnoiti]